MTAVYRILSFLAYRFRAVNAYGIHSPFLYSLYTQAISENLDNKVYARVEQIRDELARSKQLILRKDLGAGKDSGKRQVLGTIVKRQGVSKKYGRLLFRLAACIKPGSILELGTSVGIGASYLCSGAPGAQYTGIEGCSETFAVTATHPLLKESSHCRLINDSFSHALEQLLNEDRQFDLVYIDGDHRKEATLANFEKILCLCNPDSVIIFDDIHWSRGMQEAWAVIKEKPEVSLSIDLYQFGIVLFKKELSKQNIVLRF
jgi:predicted O-methyltransferase YrrM